MILTRTQKTRPSSQWRIKHYQHRFLWSVFVISILLQLNLSQTMKTRQQQKGIWHYFPRSAPTRNCPVIIWVRSLKPCPSPQRHFNPKPQQEILFLDIYHQEGKMIKSLGSRCHEILQLCCNIGCPKWLARKTFQLIGSLLKVFTYPLLKLSTRHCEQIKTNRFLKHHCFYITLPQCTKVKSIPNKTKSTTLRKPLVKLSTNWFHYHQPRTTRRKTTHNNCSRSKDMHQR